MTDMSLQQHRNGPLTDEAVHYLRDVRSKNGWSYAQLAGHLGISPAFAHNIINKGMNISTETYMLKVAEGIAALKSGRTVSGADQARDTATATLLDHTYHLRDNLRVAFKLPTDLSPREAERLGQFIGSLSR